MAGKERAIDEEDMDSSIVQDFQNLRVLAPYDFHQMDSLVHDLAYALDDTAHTKKAKHGNDSTQQKKGKRKSKKRKSSKPSLTNLVGAGNISEASESSLDEALKDYMENIIQQSDSDDLVLTAKTLPTLLKVSAHSISVAESDSFTDTFSPMRPGRRRRRFKRMAVDTQPDSDISIIDYLNEQRLKRLHTLRPKLKIQEHKSEMDSELNYSASDTQATPTKLEDSVIVGKRKRGVRHGNSFDGIIDDVSICSETGATAGKSEVVMESSSSVGSNSHSSSESDCIYTDGGREGDDEQSDFYSEAGPACGIPGIYPWWEKDKLNEDQANTRDQTKFNMILTGSFKHLSKSTQRNFMSRLNIMAQSGKKIIIGRRRLKDRKPSYTLSRFLQERQQWNDSARKWCLSQGCYSAGGACSNGGGQHGENKRQRKTPTSTPDGSGGEFVGGDADPIPDSNVGSRMLQNMGWSPGMGLGAEGAGMVSPIIAFKRSGRKGFGSSSPNTTNSAPTPQPTPSNSSSQQLPPSFSAL